MVTSGGGGHVPLLPPLGSGTNKGRPFSVFVDGFVSHFALLQFYSNHLVVSFELSRSNRMMAAILNLLMRSDQEERTKKCALAR